MNKSIETSVLGDYFFILKFTKRLAAVNYFKYANLTYACAIFVGNSGRLKFIAKIFDTDNCDDQIEVFETTYPSDGDIYDAINFCVESLFSRCAMITGKRLKNHEIRTTPLGWTKLD
jgi:hypothetical protein